MNGHILEQFNNSEDLGKWYNGQYTAMGDGWDCPRDAALWYINFAEILKDSSKELLDLGSGAGHFIKTAQEFVLCTGIELSTVGLDMARARVPGAKWMQVDMESMPFQDGQFNYITSIGSVEHVIHIYKALAEIHRVLKDDGRLFCWVPNEKWLYQDQPHEQTHTDEEWLEIFDNAGFKSIKLEDRGDCTAILFIKKI